MKPDFDIISNNKEALDAIMSNLTYQDRDNADFYSYQDINEIEMSGDRAYLLAVEYGKRIPDGVIRKYEATGGAVFNIHRADPRKYAGASVLNHQILKGERDMALTLLRVRAGEPLDGGEIVSAWPLNIEGLLYPEVVGLCRKHYISVVRDAIRYIKGEEPAFSPPSNQYRRRSPEDSMVPLGTTAKRIIMAADNERFPAFFLLGGRKIILRATPAEDLP